MLDLQNSQCFDSLPAFLQESIMQSGMEFETEEELRQFAQKYNVNPQ